MRRAPLVFAGALLAAGSAGCDTAVSLYHPRAVAPHELTLRYDSGFELRAEGRTVATGYRYEGLSGYVGCVPAARAHALAAEQSGRDAFGLTVAGGVLAGLGLGGLGGVAYVGKNNTAAAAFFGAGIGVELVGLALVLAGRSAKVDANGHAVDAMNYYNDAVGSVGRSCAR